MTTCPDPFAPALAGLAAALACELSEGGDASGLVVGLAEMSY